MTLDTHPVTGEPGVWKYIAGLGWVNVDPNKTQGPTTTFGNTFSDVYDDPNPAAVNADPNPVVNNEYMTQAELDAYNQANGTSFSGNYLMFHPETGEVGMWTWDPMAGWRDDTKWLGPRTTYPDGTPIVSFEDIRNGNLDPASTNNNAPASTNNNQAEEKPIGWYWTGTAWLPFYQGEGAPAGAIVAPTSTQPSGPPAGWIDAGGVDPNITNNTNNNTSNTNNTNSNTNTNNTNSTNNSNSTNNTNPNSEPPLYTPTADQFYGGLFTAFDLLNRDGGEIKSPFYDNARQRVLDSLAAQATAAGRTQNTAEEIAMAQRSAPSISAGGLFDFNNFALANELYR